MEDVVATFDMRGQNVTNQYNAGHDINFGAVQTPMELITELEKLKADFVEVREIGIVSEDIATDAEYQVTKAIQQAKKPEPNKKTILDHLSTAKTIIEGCTAATGLVTTLVNAIEALHKLFSSQALI